MEKFHYKDNRKIFHENRKGDVLYLTFPLIEETNVVRHGFSTRIGGVSQGIYASMNLSFQRGDDEHDVRENFKRIAAAIGVKEEEITFSKQTHTANVREVSLEDKGKGLTKQMDYDNVDGLVTNVPGICLATFYADCVPLFFVDPKKRAIGLSHSGWRGTVEKIGKRTVEKMSQLYGSRTEDIYAAVGPSICQDCYEVTGDVIEGFQKNFREEYWKELFYKKENGRYQLNLWKANEFVLREAGILEEHLAVTNLCTCCNPELLFSHRASYGKRGNLGAFLQLK
ncbi:peptidoglycan editing factor PgeF [Lachnoclostridium sp. An181]|uniref:peptidoglycan editing factor PgeF n=1 Tax=Lachnoclostridium sp. An181 TaxID=1965575 RepID=UPI000B38E67B|nr:peptidoglycan editing factor PgeF [Lachnoclostridium sp. An181]OUP49922.1 hypothetical protein B5F18_05400 [Lachnoclostridium sp. An181]